MTFDSLFSRLQNIGSMVVSLVGPNGPHLAVFVCCSPYVQIAGTSVSTPSVARPRDVTHSVSDVISPAQLQRVVARIIAEALASARPCRARMVLPPSTGQHKPANNVRENLTDFRGQIWHEDASAILLNELTQERLWTHTAA